MFLIERSGLAKHALTTKLHAAANIPQWEVLRGRCIEDVLRGRK